MKIELSKWEAANILLKDDSAKWSYHAAYALVEYYEALEEDLGESIELDYVALRCEWSEYKSLVEWAQDYGADFDYAPADEDERDEEIRSYINEHGTLIEFDGGIIVSSF